MLFVVIGRDGKDEGALERRMAERDGHVQGLKQGLESGSTLLGGAILSEDNTMCGSVMVVDFPDRAALDVWLKSDPYVTGNVWQDIEVLPFKLAGMAVPKAEDAA